MSSDHAILTRANVKSILDSANRVFGGRALFAGTVTVGQSENSALAEAEEHVGFGACLSLWELHGLLKAG